MSIEMIKTCQPMVWNNFKYDPFVSLDRMGLSAEQIEDARRRFRAYTPLLARLFPNEKLGHGIESPLKEVTDYFKNALGGLLTYDSLWLKLDSQLPIAGSIKARGGIYEVLLYMETLVAQQGELDPVQAILKMPTETLQAMLKPYTIRVGSTGNLGLSIGIISARLGFSVEVHMSKDAKAWKKQLLRENGAVVIENAGDYSMAVDAARQMGMGDSKAYFVDDENSKALFLGYSVAAEELKEQLLAQNITVNASNPLTVVIPCGVGGAPGGICYGLRSAFGADVKVYFAEPTHAPCMALGLMTGLHDKIAIEDYGIVLETIADGLAVGRPSQFAGVVIEPLINGVYTVSDQQMVDQMKALYQGTGEFVEPSAAAALEGPFCLNGNGTMVMWMTGGRLVPNQQRAEMLGF